MACMTATLARAAAPAHVTRYVGVSDWWGRHGGRGRGGVRGALPYRGDVPMTFAWGRRGIGSRELSRSILHDATGSEALAERLCRDFTHEVIADLPDVGLELDPEQVLSWRDSGRAAA